MEIQLLRSNLAAQESAEFIQLLLRERPFGKHPNVPCALKEHEQVVSLLKFSERRPFCLSSFKFLLYSKALIIHDHETFFRETWVPAEIALNTGLSKNAK